MKKNYYRLVDSDYCTISTYVGTKSNANAYFRRFVQRCIPGPLTSPLLVVTYSTFDNMRKAKDSISVTTLH